MKDPLEALLYGSQFRKLLEKKYETIEKRYGLYNIDILILLFLENAGENDTPKDIMEMKLFTKGHISQALGRLQQKGYVKIEHDHRDHTDLLDLPIKAVHVAHCHPFPQTCLP